VITVVGNFRDLICLEYGVEFSLREGTSSV